MKSRVTLSASILIIRKVNEMRYIDQKFSQNLKDGFTLIELLVVISIIGLLSSVVMTTTSTARVKARTAKRVADLRQIQTALELYYEDNNGYPNPGWGWRSECAAWGGLAADQVIPGLVPTYLARFPSDPSMKISDNEACYLYLSNGVDYTILDHNIAGAEGASFSYNSFPNLYDSTRDGGSNPCTIESASFWSWKVGTPGGRCW